MTQIALKISRKYYREVFTVALILLALVAFWTIQQVQAGSFTGERILLVDSSAPGVVSNQVHQIVVPSTFAAANQTFFVDLGALFTTPLNGLEDFDVEFGTSALGSNLDVFLVYNVAASAESWAVNIDATNNTRIEFVTASNSASVPAANDTLFIVMGTNADFDGSGNTQWTNPAKISAAGIADTYSITYDRNGATDTGTGMIAIIEGVAVSVTIAETLSVDIAAVTSGSCTGFLTGDTEITTTVSTVPFGTSAADTFFSGCQQVRVASNASAGFSATSEQNTSLYAGGNTIDDFSLNSANPSTAGAWDDLSTEGFGYACDDIAGDATCTNDFTTANSLYVPFADQSISNQIKAEFMSASAPIASTTQINYRLLFTSTQPAGTYQNIITYIFTPTF